MPFGRAAVLAEVVADAVVLIGPAVDRGDCRPVSRASSAGGLTEDAQLQNSRVGLPAQACQDQ